MGETTTESQRLLTVQDVAQRYQVRPGTVYGWVARGEIPFHKVGTKLVRFDPKELDGWERKKK